MRVRKFHGVLSILLVALAWAAAVVVVYLKSPTWGLVYAAAILVGAIVAVGVFCAKCPAKGECAHVFPGFLTRYLPKRASGPYALWENLVVGAGLGLPIVFPFFFLWDDTTVLAVYGILLAAALFDIRCAVCPGCKNVYCSLNARSKRRF